MKSLTLLLLLFPYIASACPLNGYWKSNESLTLNSLRSAKNVTARQNEIFSDNFFGKLVINIQCGEFTAVMEDWVETTKYELISFDGENVVIKYSSEIEGEVEKISKIQGECYSLSINDGQFEEFFCPIDKNEYEKELRKAIKLKALIDSEEAI